MPNDTKSNPSVDHVFSPPIELLRTAVTQYPTLVWEGLPARSRMTWSSRGNSEKWGILFAHSTRVKSCLSAAWQMFVTGSLGFGKQIERVGNYLIKLNRGNILFISIKDIKWIQRCENMSKPHRKAAGSLLLPSKLLTELPPELPSAWSSVFCSTAISASRIFSTGISSFTALVDSTSPSRSLFLCRSSWTAAKRGIGVYGGEGGVHKKKTMKDKKGEEGTNNRQKGGGEEVGV